MDNVQRVRKIAELVAELDVLAGDFIGKMMTIREAIDEIIGEAILGNTTIISADNLIDINSNASLIQGRGYDYGESDVIDINSYVALPIDKVEMINRD